MWLTHHWFEGQLILFNRKFCQYLPTKQTCDRFFYKYNIFYYNWNPFGRFHCSNYVCSTKTCSIPLSAKSFVQKLYWQCQQMALVILKRKSNKKISWNFDRYQMYLNWYNFQVFAFVVVSFFLLNIIKTVLISLMKFITGFDRIQFKFNELAI